MTRRQTKGVRYMAKKQTKDIRYMVEEANKLLKSQHFQDNEADRKALMNFVEHILLQRGMYHGYNFYEYQEVAGEPRLVYAGKETSLIQYYIS